MKIGTREVPSEPAATSPLKAAGSNLGEVCRAEEPGGCADDVRTFLQPPGQA